MTEMQLLAAVRKDVLLQWRSRSRSVAVFVFGATVLLLFSFAVGPNVGALRQHATGFLWLAILLSSTLTLADTFQSEMEQRALEGLLLLPVSCAALFYAKALVNWLQLSALGLSLLPFMVMLYDVPLPRVPALVGIILLGRWPFRAGHALRRAHRAGESQTHTAAAAPVPARGPRVDGLGARLRVAD